MHEHLETRATRVELLVDESLHPDDNAILPVNYHGPELVAVAYSDQLATLTGAGRHVVPLSVSDAAAIILAARCARDERSRSHADTALDRVITTMRVRFDDPRGEAGSFTMHAGVNHSAPGSLPPGWSLLLRLLRDAAGRADVDNEAWDRALTWMEPSDLGEVWREGGVVKLSSIATAVECREFVYLRVGQPPQRSVLYRLSASGKLHQIEREGEDEREVPPVEPPYGRGWRLPCGGGVLALHHEWKQPARVMIRVDDAVRGMYVQRG